MALLPRRKGEKSGVVPPRFHGIKVRHADSTRCGRSTRRLKGREGGNHARGEVQGQWLARRRALFRWYTR